MVSRLHLLAFLAFLLTLLMPKANANTISITQALVSIGPNEGSGDNVSSTMGGRGTFISGGGGASCDFCGGSNFFLPGQSVSASVGFIAPLEFLSTVQIGGITFDPNDVTFGSAFISSGTIRFPAETNTPPIFTIILPASFSEVHGATTNQQLTLAIHSGELVLSFDLMSPSAGATASYFYSSGEFITTPEPGTLVLLATGLAVVGSLLRRRAMGIT
jgi:PEP-CTERM motif